MLEVFTVVARESVELALIVHFLIDGLPKAHAHRAGLAIVASAFLGGAMGVASATLLGMAFLPGGLLSLMSMVLALYIIGKVTGSLETIPRLRRSITAKASDLPDRMVAKAAVVTGLIAGIRESTEVSLPVLTLSEDLGRMDLLVSIAAGLLLAVYLGLAWPRLRDRVGAQVLFRVSALLLALIAADMLIGSLDALRPYLASQPYERFSGMETMIGALVTSQSSRATLMVVICLLALRRWWREL